MLLVSYSDKMDILSDGVAVLFGFLMLAAAAAVLMTVCTVKMFKAFREENENDPSNEKPNRALRLTALITALTLTLSLGTVCFFEWLFITAFEDIHRYPIRCPLSIAGGLLAVLLLCLCIWAGRAIRPRRYELAAAIVFPPALTLPGLYFWQAAGELIAGIWRQR